MALSKGIGMIKVSKNEDGSFKATAVGVEDVNGPTERSVILKINDSIKTAIEGDERKAPFRIIQ